MLSPPTSSLSCVFVLFLACYLAAMPLPWLTHDSGLSSSGLICCYAMSPVELTQESFGYIPSVCLATGIVNFYTVMGLPAISGWTAVPQGSSVLACWLAPTP